MQFCFLFALELNNHRYFCLQCTYHPIISFYKIFWWSIVIWTVYITKVITQGKCAMWPDLEIILDYSACGDQRSPWPLHEPWIISGPILGLHPANERRGYFVTMPLRLYIKRHNCSQSEYRGQWFYFCYMVNPMMNTQIRRYVLQISISCIYISPNKIFG